MWGSVQSETSEISEVQLIQILKSIPYTIDLVLKNIYVSESFFSQEIEETELSLHKLRSLLVDYCVFETPTVFNKIPEKVLKNLVFTFEPNDEKDFQCFFDRQSNIEKLEIFENDQINFDHLKLVHLKISSGADFPSMIRQQPKLQYIDFAITWVEDETFAEVCQLKHLEVLKTLVDQVSCAEFKNLKNISTLKELRLDSHTSFEKGHLYELSLMRPEFLEKLTLLCSERKISEEIFIQLANNFRRLKSIELINRSVKIISTIMEIFPNLDALLLDFFAIFGAPDDILVINDNLKHANLKQLVVTNVHIHEVENSKALLKLLSVCPNLERIMLSELKEISIEGLDKIFKDHANLTHLSLSFEKFEINQEVIKIVDSAEKLVHIRFSGLSLCPSYTTLKAIFIKKFSKITVYKFSTGDTELIMKRSNVPDWYLNFKLMNHF